MPNFYVDKRMMAVKLAGSLKERQNKATRGG